MKRTLILSVVLGMLLPIFTAHGSRSFDALFQKANQHFEAGDFDAAAELYLSIERQGCANPKVFYNLGNCYLKKGDVGNAILYYRRAERLAPHDEDIQANLAVARSLVNKPVEPASTGFFGRMTARIFHALTPRVLTILFSIFYLSAIGLMTAGTLAIRRRIRKRLFRLGMVMIAFLLITGTLLGMDIHRIHFEQHAVAVGKETTARSGPGEHFEEVFTLQPGYEMTINRQENEWVEVTLENGYTGWVPESAVKKIQET